MHRQEIRHTAGRASASRRRRARGMRLAPFRGMDGSLLASLRTRLAASPWPFGLAAVALLLTAADHWTTYVCLSGPVDGWDVREGNPLAEWLFVRAGLVPGLLIDSVITAAAIGLLLTSRSFAGWARISFLTALVLSTGYAVANNLHAIDRLGLRPLGALG